MDEPAFSRISRALPSGRERFTRGPDGEPEQAGLRVIIAMVIFAYPYGSGAFRDPAGAIGPPFELAILDMQMPVLGGIEVVSKYRDGPHARPGLPFVIPTASATTEARDVCARANVHAYLTKPVKSRRLIGVVRDATGAKSAAARGLAVEPR